MHPSLWRYARVLKSLFWNDDERRLRAMWRIYGVFILYTIGFILVPTLIPNETIPYRTPVLYLLLLLWTLTVIALAAQVIDHRSISDFGLHINQKWIYDGIAGIVIGFSIPASSFVVLLLINGIDTFDWNSALSPADLALLFTTSLLIAVVEELVFRGYIIRNSAEGLYSRWFSKYEATLLAWVVSALFFIHVHETPNFISVVHFWGAGLLLGLAFIHTGELGLSIGIHACYNFGTAHIFNLGGEAERSLLIVTTSMPLDIIGQTGVLSTVFVIIALLLLELWIGISHGWPEVNAQLAVYELNKKRRQK